MAEPLPPLAESEDVVKALGVSDISKLPSTMQVRMDGALVKVSRRFRKEAQRIFTPGEYTHTLRVHAGAVRLMEQPNSVTAVRVAGLSEYDWETGDSMSALAWAQEGAWLSWPDWHQWGINGRMATITYAWDTPVDPDVVVAVADIVGRNLTVDPLSALPQSKMLMSRYHRQDVSSWVGDGHTGFTRDDIAQARSYRYPVPPVIVANMGAATNTHAYLSDSAW